jgi:hypothetical protein
MYVLLLIISFIFYLHFIYYVQLAGRLDCWVARQGKVRLPWLVRLVASWTPRLVSGGIEAACKVCYLAMTLIRWFSTHPSRHGSVLCSTLYPLMLVYIIVHDNTWCCIYVWYQIRQGFTYNTFSYLLLGSSSIKCCLMFSFL